MSENLPQKAPEMSVIESVIVQGDLSKLTSEERVTYYQQTCRSLGLNPLTRPLEYVVLNGKLTLYARKDATEQLRALKGVSIEKLEEKVVGDVYIVKATARTKDGRTDTSTGAVSFGHLKGEAQANAIMKAETKAKRRVTLSICGLGFLDEMEVETIPQAKTINVDLNTGEIPGEIVVESPIPSNTVPSVKLVSKEQIVELESIIPDVPKEVMDSVWSVLKQRKQTKLSEVPATEFHRLRDHLLNSRKVKNV